MLLALSFLVYLPPVLSGFWLAQRLWRDPSPQAVGLKLCLGLPLGLGLWSLGYYLWLWVGLSQLIFPWLELAVSLVLAVFALPGLKPLFTALNWQALKTPFNLAFLLIASISAALFGLYLYMSPHGFEDAWFIWNLDARFIYLARDWRVLYAPNGPGWHPDYPLLVSLNTVSGWVILGQATPRIQMAATTLFTLALPGGLFSGLALLKDSRAARLATIIVLASPMVINYGVSQQADVPVAGYLLASLTLLALYFQTRAQGLLPLAGLTTALAAWAKNEGMLFLLVTTFGVVVFLALLRQPRALKDYFSGLALPLAVILLFKLTLPVSNDLFGHNFLAQLVEGERYLFIFSKLFQLLTTLGWWTPFSLLALLLVYGVLVGLDYPEPLVVKFVGLVLGLQLLGYFAIYLITPHDLAWHVNTSLERLLVQLFPAALLLFFYATASPVFKPSEG